MAGATIVSNDAHVGPASYAAQVPWVSRALCLACALSWTAPLAAQASEDPYQRRVIPALSRPADAKLRACSFREPACVHTVGKVPIAHVLPALSALENAVRGLRALGLEPPRDGGAGSNQAFDLYLVPSGGAAAWSEPRLYGRGLDRINAFGVAAVDGLRGCALASEVARVSAQAALLDLDAAISEGTLAMQSSHLASLIAPCAELEAAALDRFQRGPELALTQGSRERFEGSMLFSSYLDQEHGKDQPAGVMTGLVALGTQATPDNATYWNNEPDVFDLLRRFLPASDLTLGDVLADFAVARAFVGSRSDGQHLGDTERFGLFGRVRFDWAVPYASLPRRLAPRAPIQPTGSTYVWVDTSKAAADRGLVADIQWETSFVYQWSAVRVDREGRELGRMTSGGVFGKDRAQLTVESLNGAAGLLLVGVSLGHDDRSSAFDPESGAPREAGYELTLHPLPATGGSATPARVR
jgi:hypothetical protein